MSKFSLCFNVIGWSGALTLALSGSSLLKSGSQRDSFFSSNMEVFSWLGIQELIILSILFITQLFKDSSTFDVESFFAKAFETTLELAEFSLDGILNASSKFSFLFLGKWFTILNKCGFLKILLEISRLSFQMLFLMMISLCEHSELTGKLE